MIQKFTKRWWKRLKLWPPWLRITICEQKSTFQCQRIRCRERCFWSSEKKRHSSFPWSSPHHSWTWRSCSRWKRSRCCNQSPTCKEWWCCLHTGRNKFLELFQRWNCSCQKQWLHSKHLACRLCLYCSILYKGSRYRQCSLKQYFRCNLCGRECWMPWFQELHYFKQYRQQLKAINCWEHW